jgi:CRISPR-associated protein Csd1
MILKALYDYYHRSDDPTPAGWIKKEIEFIIVINEDGEFLRIENRRRDKKTCQTFVVPKAARSGKTPKPYLFNDTIEYTLGYSNKNTEDASLTKLNAFIEQCKSVAMRHADNKQFSAVAAFYENGGIQKVKECDQWESIKKSKGNVSFLLQGHLHIVAEDPDLQSEINLDADEIERVCLVTGERSPIIRLSSNVHLAGANTAGAYLVSFQKNSGYDSWNKEQCSNSPISKEAEAAYSAALHKMLDKESRNKFSSGNRTFLFWASNNNTISRQAEDGLYALLSMRNDIDDPDRNIAKVKEIFNSIYSGRIKTTVDDKFYFLGLAPNAARIAVVYWAECTLKEFAHNLLRHFKDMEIVDTRIERKPYSGLYKILAAVTLNGKQSEVQPNLPEAIMKSIVQGYAYPYILFAGCLRRIKAEQEVKVVRAAIIKAYLIRKYNDKLTTMLNEDNNNVGYVCGRLFAVIEREQEKANNSTNIAARYLNSASTTPSVVFPTLLNLSIHHEEKLEDRLRVYFAKLKGEIVDKLANGEFPSNLSIDNQGRFMVGYYQQRQDFFRPKDKDNQE